MDYAVDGTVRSNILQDDIACVVCDLPGTKQIVLYILNWKTGESVKVHSGLQVSPTCSQTNPHFCSILSLPRLKGTSQGQPLLVKYLYTAKAVLPLYSTHFRSVTWSHVCQTRSNPSSYHRALIGWYFMTKVYDTISNGFPQLVRAGMAENAPFHSA